MKKIIILFLLINTHQTFPQEFEGKIVYKNSCQKTKNSVNSFDLDKFLSFMGDTTVYITKKGSYKQITNGMFKPYQLYNSSEPKLYFKEKIKSDTLFYIDYRKFKDLSYEYELEKNSDTILGYNCHKLIITFKEKSSEMHYYFAPELKQNPTYFKEFRHDNLNNVMELTQSVILRYVNFGGGMKITREAIKIEKRKINSNEFKIPKGIFLINYSDQK